MITNFLNYWILARIVEALAVALLCLVGTVTGLRVAVRWRWGESSEEQLALERRAELVATVMQVALILKMLGLGLSVFVADHLVGSIRGAMCAFGVLASTKTGYYGLLATFLSAVVCFLWVILHRLDLLLEAPVLTRRKFRLLLLVAPVVLCDFGLVVAFAYELDFSVIASCCSVWLDDNVVSTEAAAFLMSPMAAGLLGCFGAFSAVAAAAAAWRWPQRATALTAGAISALAPVAALLAILWVVAPHVLGTPQHPCPFCLFHAQGDWIGWPLFSAIFVGSVTGMGIGVVELNRGVIADSTPARAMQRTLARWSVLAWTCALIVGVLPVAGYLLKSGGVSVFGEI